MEIDLLGAGEAEAGERNGIQVIARAAALLRAVESTPEGVSLGELAQRTGLARSTVQRIVSALTDEHFLVSVGARGGIKLGPALVRLAAAADVGIERIVRPKLEDLARELGETVDLSVLQGRTATFVDQAVGAQRLVALSAIGATFPLYCTANGKAMLSCIAAGQRRARLPRSLRRLTPATVTDLAALEAEVAGIGPGGAALDMEEHSEGICAAGAGFIDPVGRIFALSVPAPAERFRAKQPRIVERLLASRAALLRLMPGACAPA